MRNWLALVISIAAIAAGPAVAQHVAEPPTPSASAAVPGADEQTLIFRVASQGRMTVPVMIGTAGPYDFVVDTGAERSVVSNELAHALGLVAGPRMRLFDFTGATMTNSVAVPAITVSRLDSSAMTAPSLALANIGAAGMLGIDALQGHKVVIDFPRNRMLLTAAKRHAQGDVVVRAAPGAGQLIITKATFNGQPIAVVIDTGSWVSVGNTAMLALARRAPRVFRPIEVFSVTGRKFVADLVTVDDIDIGGVRFDNFGLAFADVPPFERFGLAKVPALILGIGSLKLFRRVELDFLNREVAFSMPVPHLDFNDVCSNTASPCRSY